MVRLMLAVVVVFGVVAAAVAITRGSAPTKVVGHAKVIGDPVRGEVLFKGFCSECHVLKAAAAKGRFGPNLDNLKPSYARVIRQVTTGGTGGVGLPPAARLTFGPGIHTFTKADIRDIAAFVFYSTHT